MLGFEKVYSVHTCLSFNSRGVTKDRLKQIASCSEATLFRIIRFMKRELNAPIEHIKSTGLYRYQSGIIYELPGIWFKGHELASLLELLSRLEELQAEFVTGAPLKPFIEKLETLLESRQVPKSAINQRDKFLPMQMRQINGEIFRSVMETLFAGKQMRIRHQDRTVGKITERKISPQKIVRYRDNWYLDSYCHLREGLRTFSLSGILEVEILKEKARLVSEKELQEYFASAYGFFGGKADKVAEILLFGSAARMAISEAWHPYEVRETMPDGKIKLKIPYRDARELLGDILKQGNEAEILGPPELRSEMIKKLKQLSKNYL